MEDAQSNAAKAEASARYRDTCLHKLRRLAVPYSPSLAEERLRQSLEESERLRGRLRDSEAEAQNLRERQSAERDVGTDLRKEAMALREQLRSRESESDSLREEAADLRAHVQRYVREVERVEELLAQRERERDELIGQYRRLSEEADSAEAFGRKMEAQVGHVL